MKHIAKPAGVTHPVGPKFYSSQGNQTNPCNFCPQPFNVLIVDTSTSNETTSVRPPLMILYLATSTFSIPWSPRTLEGRPNTCTHCSVLALLSVQHFRYTMALLLPLMHPWMTNHANISTGVLFRRCCRFAQRLNSFLPSLNVAFEGRLDCFFCCKLRLLIP